MSFSRCLKNPEESGPYRNRAFHLKLNNGEVQWSTNMFVGKLLKKKSGQVLSKMLSKDFIIIKYHHQAKFYKVKDNFNIFFPVQQQ